MSRLTNDIDAINQAVSQNVTALIASVALAGRYRDRHVRAQPLAGAGHPAGGADHVWFTNFVARYTRKGFRELQKQPGRAERRDGRSHQRAESGQGLPPQ